MAYGGSGLGSRPLGSPYMLDVLTIVATVACFAVALLYVHGCEKLGSGRSHG